MHSGKKKRKSIKPKTQTNKPKPQSKQTKNPKKQQHRKAHKKAKSIKTLLNFLSANYLYKSKSKEIVP